jgi:BMFP domain-containing protein YqiC
MQTDNRLLDDLARLASGALGTAAGLREEVESAFRQRMERWLRDMDLPSRDELDAARDMAARARQAQEDLEERVARLEASLATLLAERELSHEHPGPRRPARRSEPKPKAADEADAG